MVSVPILDASPADAAIPTDVGVTAIAATAATSSASVEYDAAAALSPSPRYTSRLAFWKYRGDLSAVLSARATKNTDSVVGMENLIVEEAGNHMLTVRKVGRVIQPVSVLNWIDL